MLDCVFLLELGNLLVRLVFMRNALVEHLPWVYLDNITDVWAVVSVCRRMFFLWLTGSCLWRDGLHFFEPFLFG